MVRPNAHPGGAVACNPRRSRARPACADSLLWWARAGGGISRGSFAACRERVLMNNLRRCCFCSAECLVGMVLARVCLPGL